MTVKEQIIKAWKDETIKRKFCYNSIDFAIFVIEWNEVTKKLRRKVNESKVD